MLISLTIDNCLIFDQKTEFSLKANMQSKRFLQNVAPASNNVNVVKSAIVIGPNNSGKTNLVKIIEQFKMIILNQPNNDILPSGLSNVFTKNTISSLGITFTVDKQEYLYSIKYDNHEKAYVYERFAEIKYDRHENAKEDEWLLRDLMESKIKCKDGEKAQNIIKVASKNNLIIHLLDTSHFATLDKIKEILMSFANSIDVIDVNDISFEKTIEMLKKRSFDAGRLVNFIKQADLYLDDFKYLPEQEFQSIMSNLPIDDKNNTLSGSLHKTPIMDLLHLMSVYKNIPFPSIAFDSNGTQKVEALAGYVLNALESGRILVVDELDNSLHFKLTRAIIAMFNNELNKKAQLIATVHDVSLLDCQTLFRKEQIWFTHKDKEHAYLYSLAEFTAERDGIRETTDLQEKYKKGALGALPNPDLFESLADVCKTPTSQSHLSDKQLEKNRGGEEEE